MTIGSNLERCFNPQFLMKVSEQTILAFLDSRV
jgi:hypothetical protein